MGKVWRTPVPPSAGHGLRACTSAMRQQHHEKRKAVALPFVDATLAQCRLPQGLPAARQSLLPRLVGLALLALMHWGQVRHSRAPAHGQRTSRPGRRQCRSPAPTLRPGRLRCGGYALSGGADPVSAQVRCAALPEKTWRHVPQQSPCLDWIFQLCWKAPPRERLPRCHQ